MIRTPTTFVTGTELEAGDVILDEDRCERTVALVVVEGDRAHVMIRGEHDGVVLTENDVVEIVERTDPRIGSYAT